MGGVHADFRDLGAQPRTVQAPDAYGVVQCAARRRRPGPLSTKAGRPVMKERRKNKYHWIPTPRLPPPGFASDAVELERNSIGELLRTGSEKRWRHVWPNHSGFESVDAMIGNSEQES